MDASLVAFEMEPRASLPHANRTHMRVHRATMADADMVMSVLDVAARRPRPSTCTGNPSRGCAPLKLVDQQQNRGDVLGGDALVLDPGSPAIGIRGHAHL